MYLFFHICFCNLSGTWEESGVTKGVNLGPSLSVVSNILSRESSLSLSDDSDSSLSSSKLGGGGTATCGPFPFLWRFAESGTLFKFSDEG